MAHFAQLDAQNNVIRVLAVDNLDVGDLAFPESEPVGQAFLATVFPDESFKQTSYNGNFRFRFAQIGGEYHPECDGFCPPKGYDYFVFDTAQCLWVPPVPYPPGGGVYVWDDPSYSWVVINVPFTAIGE